MGMPSTGEAIGAAGSDVWWGIAMKNFRKTVFFAHLRAAGEHSRPGCAAALLLACTLPLASPAFSQSTKASLFGIVHDATGATVAGAQITVTSTLTHASRQASSDASGAFTVLNLEPDTYTLTVVHAGFARDEEQGILLTARDQQRVELTLQPASVQTQVTVSAAQASTINTEDSSISDALSPSDVLALPANYRGNGSTSPLTVIQTLPGVQPDSASFPPAASASPNPSVKFSIQGGLPSQSETTVDGISAQNQTTNNVQADAFPSAESVAEIRVDGVNNNAEYGQPGEITTVTKQGTNNLHGSAFWYFQNQAFDAIPYGSATKPHKVANDFGGSLGGPIVIPHLYDGHNRTFFFGTYEGLRFPQSTLEQYVVPTVAMKQGNFSQETASLANPFQGGAYPNASLPAINPSAAAFLSLFPDPNTGNTQSVAAALSGLGYNYRTLKDNTIGSNQFDVRGDQVIGSRAFVFGRFTWKNISQTQPNVLLIPNSEASTQYRIFASSFTYAFTPHVSNEFRFGFTLEQDGSANPLDGASYTNAAGLQGIGPNYPFNGITYLQFTQLTPLETPGTNGRLTYSEQSRLFQYVDNLSWQEGRHTLRFGADVRTLQANTPLDATAGDNYGSFLFAPGQYTGQEFADFLVGAPYQSYTDDITTNNRGRSDAYAFYAQDNWRATENLNLTFGVRYEFHPPFQAIDGNLGNFDPSIAKSGQLIYPTGYANLLSAPELANFNACPTAGVANPAANGGTENGAPCTPVLSSSAAGIPTGLRFAPKLRFEPRFGFAWRPSGNDKTVVSGGAGYYNITTSGAIFYALTGTLQTDEQIFNNSAPGTTPSLVFPNVGLGNALVPQYGTAPFNSAVDIHWHDPYSLQSALSVEHEFPGQLAARLSYVGLSTRHLVWQPNYNDLPLSSTTPAAAQPRSAFPFPNFQTINSRNTEASANYNSLQAELRRRFTRGLSFTAAYTLAKNLSDNQGTEGSFGTNPSSFSDEQGGYYATWAGNRSLDYGNVSGTRRHRLLLTGLTDIPVGRGRQFGGNMPRAADAVIGGWQITNIFVWQTGPFLTPFIPSGIADPSGTGSGILYSRPQRPDRVARGNTSAQNRRQWFSTAAFACPGGGGFAQLQAPAPNNCSVGVGSAPIGRFGTESVGSVEGPGTVNLSTGVNKTLAVTERVHLRAEGSFTNVLNHTNLADPTLDVTSPAFGTITQARGSDFGGNRTGQVSLKLEF